MEKGKKKSDEVGRVSSVDDSTASSSFNIPDSLAAVTPKKNVQMEKGKGKSDGVGKVSGVGDSTSSSRNIADPLAAVTQIKKVLILMSDTGGGHRASAEAIRAFIDLLSGDQICRHSVEICSPEIRSAAEHTSRTDLSGYHTRKLRCGWVSSVFIRLTIRIFCPKVKKKKDALCKKDASADLIAGEKICGGTYQSHRSLRRSHSQTQMRLGFKRVHTLDC